MLKLPEIVELNTTDLFNRLAKLPTTGTLRISANKLIYLDIDNRFIHYAFPIIKNPTMQKPNYFDTHGIGAHISVIYPEEKHHSVSPTEFGKIHQFRLKRFVRATINTKHYFVILVEAPSLVNLRVRHGSPEQLNFKGFIIDFHITIGVSFNPA